MVRSFYLKIQIDVTLGFSGKIGGGWGGINISVLMYEVPNNFYCAH